MTPLYKDLSDALHIALQEDLTFKYRDSLEESEFYNIIKKDWIEEQTKDASWPIDPVYFSWLMELSFLHLEYAIFLVEEKKERKKAERHLALANEYGYVCIDYGNKSCGCFESRNPFIVINKAAFMMSNMLLCGDPSRSMAMGRAIVSSLNGHGCIVKRGYKHSTIAWFIVQLHALSSQQKIDLHPLLKPKLPAHLGGILADWDTDDLKKVDENIKTLCDFHLSQASIDCHIYQEKEYGSGDYIELFLPHLCLFPFEVLYWLKIRRLHGKDNPNSFSHPLMKSPTARFYLEINQPLLSSKAPPFIDLLMGRIAEQCDKFSYP